MKNRHRGTSEAGNCKRGGESMSVDVSGEDKKTMFTQIIQRVARDLGEDTAKAVQAAIVDEAGGLRLTVPYLHNLQREMRNDLIRKKFTGFNYGELSERFGISTNQIRRIVIKG